MVEQLVDVLQFFDALILVAEQAVEVSKVIIECIPPRTSFRELKTLSQHATQDGMMTKLGPLKSGKLTDRWMMERGNPL